MAKVNKNKLLRSSKDREDENKTMERFSENNLESLLSDLLMEADPIQRPESMADFEAVSQEPVSLDQAIDRYLVQYEREAIPTSEVFESAELHSLTGYLLEQAEEEEPEAGGEEGGLDLDLGGLGGAEGDEAGAEDDPTAGLDLGGEGEVGDEAEKEKPVVQTPKINLQDFTRSVARLTNNVQSLIDLKTIILNRAKRYIQNNYDERTAKEMMEILETSYDLVPADVTNSHMEDEKYPQPRTAVTGPVGG